MHTDQIVSCDIIFKNQKYVPNLQVSWSGVI